MVYDAQYTLEMSANILNALIHPTYKQFVYT